jgi:mannose-6-phosphate isomerase-like protein (cupin superfamily)
MNYYKQTDSSNVFQIPAYHDGDGTFDVCQLFENKFEMPIKAAIWELKPGGGEGMHRHGDDGELEEFYYFLEGEAIMYVEGEKISVKAGDSILVPHGVDHGFKNIGSNNLKVLVIWGAPKLKQPR